MGLLLNNLLYRIDLCMNLDVKNIFSRSNRGLWIIRLSCVNTLIEKNCKRALLF